MIKRILLAIVGFVLGAMILFLNPAMAAEEIKTISIEDLNAFNFQPGDQERSPFKTRLVGHFTIIEDVSVFEDKLKTIIELVKNQKPLIATAKLVTEEIMQAVELVGNNISYKSMRFGLEYKGYFILTAQEPVDLDAQKNMLNALLSKGPVKQRLDYSNLFTRGFVVKKGTREIWGYSFE